MWKAVCLHQVRYLRWWIQAGDSDDRTFSLINVYHIFPVGRYFRKLKLWDQIQGEKVHIYLREAEDRDADETGLLGNSCLVNGNRDSRRNSIFEAFNDIPRELKNLGLQRVKREVHFPHSDYLNGGNQSCAPTVWHGRA